MVVHVGLSSYIRPLNLTVAERLNGGIVCSWHDLKRNLLYQIFLNYVSHTSIAAPPILTKLLLPQAYIKLITDSWY